MQKASQGMEAEVRLVAAVLCSLLYALAQTTDALCLGKAQLDQHKAFCGGTWLGLCPLRTGSGLEVIPARQESSL